MAFTYNQEPPVIAFTQSPTILSVTWDGYESSSGFQYICDLYYWTGSQADRPATSQYTLVKYPNESGAGIFDFSRILNSTLDEAHEDLTNDNVKWFTYDVNYQFLSGSTYITGSSSGVWGNERLAIDGYQLFGQVVQNYSQSIGDENTIPPWFSPFYPVLTDGPATQSVFYNCDEGYYQPDLAPSVISYNPGHTTSLNGFQTTGFQVDFSDGQGVFELDNTGSLSSGSDFVIQKYDLSPLRMEYLFGLYCTGSFHNVTHYDISWYTYGNVLYPTGSNSSLRFEIESLQKYPNVQIMWKNRYGEMDYYNFKLVSRNSFNVSRSQYQPQVGTWNRSTLGYEPYQTAIANYLVDTNTSLVVNSDWLSEDYNDILKQLMVSDEIYWIFDPVAHYSDFREGIRTLTIKTSDIQFKTGVVDKLIQYSFEFDYGQSYKLIL